MMTNINKYGTRITPSWCPGCGIFGLFTAIKQALHQLHFQPDQVCFFYDIGCSSNMANSLKTYGFNGLHGRSLPAAIGPAIAHHQFPIFALAGDGGAYGEGLNHLIHACRTNIKLTYVVLNNHLYSLTTGQSSPTTFVGQKTKTNPQGAVVLPFNPIKTALVNHGSFVARGYTGKIDHLTQLIIQAYHHPGFSFIDVLSPCVTWAKAFGPEWFAKRITKLPNKNNSVAQALELTSNEPDKLPIGIFYQEKRPTYQQLLPQLNKTPLIKQSISKIDISKLVSEFI